MLSFVGRLVFLVNGYRKETELNHTGDLAANACSLLSSLVLWGIFLSLVISLLGLPLIARSLFVKSASGSSL